MKYKDKMDLVIIQAFPANQTISQGIIDFLSDYFVVHFINLPGFHPSVPPLKSPSIENYAGFVQREIDKLNLRKFVLAGISFGFLLACKLKLDSNKCLAILASGPFLGNQFLKMPKIKRASFYLMTQLLSRGGMAEKVWHNENLALMLGTFFGDKTDDVIKVVLNEVDPITFTVTAKMLLKHDEMVAFHHDIPHILLINPNDSIVDFEKVTKTFVGNISMDNLRVILTSVEHFPKKLTYEYFSQAFSNNEMSAMFDFLYYVEKKKLGNLETRTEQGDWHEDYIGSRLKLGGSMRGGVD